jgi:hypothetical protein
MQVGGKINLEAFQKFEGTLKHVSLLGINNATYSIQSPTIAN